MNKKEAVSALKEKYAFTTEQAENNLNSILDLINEALITDKEFSITGWGKFIAVDKPARTGRNPKTGEPLEIAATTAVKFKVGSKLKTAIKNGEVLELQK